MKRKLVLLAVLLGVIAASAAAAWLLAPRYSPAAARARAVALLERDRSADGLARLAEYAQRFPDHALAAPTISVGRPPRLTVELGERGLILDGPALPPDLKVSDVTVDPDEPPPPTADVVVEQGPIWVSPTLVVYATRDEQALALVRLDVLTRDYETFELPQPPWGSEFGALARLLDQPAAWSLRPDLGGATQPRLLAASPDGSWLIFRAAAAGEAPYELWRCRVDGSEAQRLSPLETACRAVSFDPAGGRLAYFDGATVRVVGLADTASREVQTYEAAAVLSPPAPAWSPDGGSLAWGVGSADAFRLVTRELRDDAEPRERPRLHELGALQFVGDQVLLQGQRRLDDDRRLVTLRSNEDAFASRILLEDARDPALSERGDLLAVRAGDGLRVIWYYRPLAELSPGQWPEAKLPERPEGPPEPASPAPGDAAPPRPERPTRPL